MNFLNMISCKKYLSFILLLLLSTCKSKDIRYNYYFIPKGYSGWVNIVFNSSDSKNIVYRNGNTSIYFLTGDPLVFPVKSEKNEEGYIEEKYFWYSNDTLIELRDGTRPNSQIFFEGIVGVTKIQNEKIDLRNKFEAWQFYISAEPVKDENDFMSNVPQNPFTGSK